MILECPACHAKYNVPDNAVGDKGRTVRCAKCANEWFAAPPISIPSSPIVDSDILEAIDKKEAKKKPAPAPKKLKTKKAKPAATKKSAPANAPKKNASQILSAVMIASLLLALTGTFVVYKPLWFGINKPSYVTLSDIALAKQTVENKMEYAVSGKLVNSSRKAAKPPIVRITLVDKEGKPLQYWEPRLPDVIEADTALPFNFGPLRTSFTTGTRLVVEVGTPLQLALRSKP